VSDRAVLPAQTGAADTESGGGRDDDLTSLRSILLGPAEAQLQKLQARMDDRAAQARDVGAVLPQALLQRALDPELARALTPPVENAITASVRRNPRPLADALFPVIGPAIRKAVAASLASMVESLNRTLEHSVSWRAMRWRLEAYRTGKSFGEIVLLNTLLYRVEQVFLIHRKTGLLLEHVRASPARVADAQMVSAMLTAIRDFVQDSFRTADQDSLDALEVGDLSVWIEQGPSAILAAVIRGTAPKERRQVLQTTLETLHLQFGEALESFDGDTHVFEATRPALEECLQAEFRAERASRGRAPLVLGAIGIAALCLWGAFSLRERARWTRYVAALQSEPGLVVISTGRAGGKYAVSGLRDPLARDPQTLLGQSDLSAEDVVGTWEPYQALATPFVLARARHVLQPPPGATLSLRAGVLSAAGHAPPDWIASTTRMAPFIAGVTSFDATGLLESEARSLIRRIEAVTVLFEKGSADAVPGQDDLVRAVASDLRELNALGRSAHRVFRIDVVGHTDGDGDPASNLPLSRARAERILIALNVGAMPNLEVRAVGVGSGDPVVSGESETDKQRNRRVTVRVPATAARAPEDAPR
jgi:outer membrane protein OmpA-like peptidoglycan-associated protein